MRLERITPQEAENYFAKNDTVIITTGSIECHGTHNALGVDTLIPARLLELIEEKNQTLIAPEIPYGACDSQNTFPGTISIGADLLYQLVGRICDEFYKFGARRFVFLNGHGGNTGALDRAAQDLYEKGALGAILNWWLMSWELNPEWKGGHGGAEETAAMLAVDPSLVHMDKIEEMNLIDDLPGFQTSGFGRVTFKGVELSIPRKVTAFTKNGWIGPDHPSKATAEWGKAMLQANADYICEFIEVFKKTKLPS